VQSVSSNSALSLLGDWGGAIEGPRGQVRIGLHFAESRGIVVGSWEVPDQGLRDAKLETVVLEDTRVFCAGNLPGNQPISFEGTPSGTSIHGTYRQGGVEAPFTLTRGQPPVARARTRTTEKYTEELVTVHNGPISLEGTLTSPRGVSRPPVLVFITGSGPQNRDEEVVGVPVFGILADALARHGVAVLRLDDRGVGESTGDFATATTADFATDIEAAVRYLQARKDLGPIGLLGHSEGGLIAPMVATRNPAVKFLVLLAPPAEPGDVLLVDQSEHILRAEGAKARDIAEATAFNRLVYKTLKEGRPLSSLEDKLPAHLSPKDFTAMANQVGSPWFLGFLNSDPEATLKQLKIPTLAVFGALDVQVPPETNVPRLRAALHGNHSVTVRVLPGLNHLFQRAKTGAPREYARLEKGVDSSMLDAVSAWLSKGPTLDRGDSLAQAH
jgi:pimeloyl-ACP methyl ester carboxylesterase